MTDKLEENMRSIYRVIPVQPPQVEPLREVVREIMKKSTVAAQTATASTSMGREQALDLLILLSALESALVASKATIPDYLLERISDSVERLRGEVLT